MITTIKKIALGFGFVISLVINFDSTISSQTPKGETITSLQPEQTIERELAGGQKHKYRVEAKAGEFLQVKVVQKGIDIVVGLNAPDGKEIKQMDSPNGSQGAETLSWIADKAGEYTVAVASLEQNAAAGKYDLILQKPRPATPQDKRRIEVEQIFIEAIALLASGNEARKAEIIEKLKQAAAGWKELQDSEMAVMTTQQLSILVPPKAFEQFSKLNVEARQLVEAGTAETLRTALNKYEQLRLLSKELDNKHYEAYALHFLGYINESLGENQKAFDYYNQAVLLNRAVGDKRGEAIELNNVAKSYENLGNRQKALDYYSQALPLCQSVGDKSCEAASFNGSCTIHAILGDRQKALGFCQKAVLSFSEAGDKRSEAVTLDNIGAIYSYLGERQKAIEYHTQASQLMKAVGDKFSEATSLNNIGNVYSELGEKQKALDYYTQALTLRRNIGDKRGEATTLISIGAAYFNFGEEQKALEYYLQALPLHRAAGDKLHEGRALNGIGTIYNQLGERQRARDYLTQALPLAIAVGDKSMEAGIIYNLGLVSRDVGDTYKALEHFSRAAQISRLIGDRSSEAEILTASMAVLERMNNRRAAVFYGKQAVNRYQELRQAIRGLNRETQKNYLNQIERTYRELANILVAGGRLPEAEQVLEMLKDEEYFRFVRRDDKVAAALLDKRINLSASEKDALTRYEKIADEITKLGNEYAKLESEINKAQLAAEQKLQLIARRNEVDKKLADARTALRLFLEELKKEFSRKDERIASVEKGLQAAVKSWNDSHAVVISTIVGEKNLSIIVTTPDIQRAHIIEVAEEDLNKLIAEFRSVVLDIRTDAKPAAQKLYDLLVKPLEKDLDGVQAKTLVWSLDANLRYVPIAALWDGKRGFLAENYNNVIITLASRDSLAISPVGKNKWQALGVGVSKEVAGFSRLDNVTSELQAIIRDGSGAVQSRIKENGVLAGRRFLNEQFTYDSFRNNLGIYPVVHAATHFKFDLGTNNDGMDSFLLLGSGEKLTLAQVRDAGTIFTGIQLLTLSACDTAYGGKNSDGSEIEGFGIMAQEKGAKAVMATLWRVADDSTREFMVNFYRLYQKPGVTKAEALRQAQLSLLKSEKYAHPYFWSPFILIGNWK